MPSLLILNSSVEGASPRRAAAPAPPATRPRETLKADSIATKGWNYMVRLYRPRPEILNGTWSFPVAEPIR